MISLNTASDCFYNKELFITFFDFLMQVEESKLECDWDAPKPDPFFDTNNGGSFIHSTYLLQKEGFMVTVTFFESTHKYPIKLEVHELNRLGTIPPVINTYTTTQDALSDFVLIMYDLWVDSKKS